MSFERIWHSSYPPEVPSQIDYRKITLSNAITENAAKYGEHAALIFMGKIITYSELDELVNSLANALVGLGVKKGDKVALMLPNVPQIVIANFAAFKIGAVSVPHNPLFTEKELEYQLNDSDSSVLITLDLFLAKALALKGSTKVQKIITTHFNDYLPFPQKQLFPLVKKELYRKVEVQPDVYEFLDIMKQYSGKPFEDQSRWDDIAAFIYTGGTTGLSKGVMLTHANFSCNVQQFSAALPDVEAGKDSILAVYPFFHIAGFTGVQNLSMWNGLTCVLVPRPDAVSIIQMLEKYKPKYLPGVPTIFIGLLNNKKFTEMDLSFIKGFFTGAAPLSVDTFNQLKKLTGATPRDVFGLTESLIAAASPWKGKTKPNTVGLPLPGVDIKIVDLDTSTVEVNPGEPGEILIKGPQTMKGIYRKPQETAEVMKDGWIHTGDIGTLDEDGFLSIIDRKKDMIIASGFNIYPKEIDDVLSSHPKILEACTIGVPDEYRGETVKSYIVFQQGESITEKEVTEYCRENLAAYKVPKLIEVVDELPKSTVGKVLRRKIKEIEQAKYNA